VNASDGWDAVCVVGAATGLAALALWTAAELRSRTPVAARQPAP